MRPPALRLSELDAIQPALPHFEEARLAHVGRNQIDRRNNLLARAAKGLLETGEEPLVVARAFFRFIGDENTRAWFGNADHFIDGGFFIVEEVDPAHMEDAVE